MFGRALASADMHNRFGHREFSVVVALVDTGIESYALSMAGVKLKDYFWRGKKTRAPFYRIVVVLLRKTEVKSVGNLILVKNIYICPTKND